MAVQARIAVLPPGRRELDVRDVTLDAPGPYEVIVEQKAFGVCHSQLDRVDRAGRTEAMVLGHESIGTVVAVGHRVDYVEPGDEVSTSWVPRTPLAGRAPVPSRVVLGDGEVASTHNSFTWGTHAVIDEQYVVKVPQHIPLDLGTVIGCAVMTGAGAVVNSADVRAGQSVAVWGTGGVGLCSVAAASIVGVDTLIAVDVDDDKLELARQFGATDTVNVKNVDAVDAIRALTPHPDGTSGVDFAFDCTGIGANIPVGLASVRPAPKGSGRRGGANVLVGIPRVPFELTGMDLVGGGKSLIGCEGGSSDPERDFPTFIGWSLDGRFDATRLVTNRYRLDQINTAVDDLRSGRVRGRAVVELQGPNGE
ncbi:zinc-binding dehydrogenase [Streptomyces sp. NPDC059092]|uniref:zinc-binding dehydrogenase n=1 Tax=Streptomyces sp. NPDC059092 TaxID=3346725 RepID=UPI003689FF69